MDEATARKQLGRFLPLELLYYLLNFHYPTGAYDGLAGQTFQILLVPDQPLALPFVCESEGKKCHKAAIYHRSGTSAEQADYQAVQIMLNRRLEAERMGFNGSDLEELLQNLQLLYTYLPPTTIRTSDSPWPYPDPLEGYHRFLWSVRDAAERRICVLVSGGAGSR